MCLIGGLVPALGLLLTPRRPLIHELAGCVCVVLGAGLVLGQF